MGFDSENQGGSGRPTKYLKIASEKDDSNVVTGKFFSITEKVDGNYVDTIMKNDYGYPLPFFGYLNDIKLELDNIIKKRNGEEIKAPKIKFNFIDDQGDRYILDLIFSSDKGNVNSNVSTLLNSLAGINKFGYIKLYISNSIDGKGVKQFNINLKNHPNWATSGKNLQDFLSPKDGSEDITRVSWKYKYDELPKIEVEKIVDGEKVKINNVKKHQQFFIDLINNDILPKVKEASNYNTYSAPTSSTPSSKPKSTYTTEEDDLDSQEELPTSSSGPVSLSDDTDDLPF